MDVKDLKVGDKVYIRKDLKAFANYGDDIFMPDMQTGLQEVDVEANEFSNKIKVANDIFYYTTQMIDWKKTSKLNKKYIKNIKPIKPTYDGTTLSLGDLKVTRHIDDKEDLEKAVMMLLLKKEGYNFGDVRRIVKNTKVKWIPKDGQEFFFITYTGNISSDVYYGAWNVHEQLYKLGNCFKTKEEAKAKAEQIMRILQEGR